MELSRGGLGLLQTQRPGQRGGGSPKGRGWGHSDVSGEGLVVSPTTDLVFALSFLQASLPISRTSIFNSPGRGGYYLSLLQPSDAVTTEHSPHLGSTHPTVLLWNREPKGPS